MFLNPFEEKGSWFKGNLHTHSTHSDGTFQPEELIDGFRKHGYHFLAMTDHGRVAPQIRGENFMVISGVELTENGAHEVWLNPDVSSYGRTFVTGEDLPVTAQTLKVLCHPYWSCLTAADMQALHGFFAVEIFNTIT